MPAHKYMEENDFAVMLATKRSAGVTPEANLKEHVTYRPIPSVRLPTGFETQRRHHEKFKTVATKRTFVLQN